MHLQRQRAPGSADLDPVEVRRPEPGPPIANALMALQRQAGNAAVAQLMLARREAEAPATAHPQIQQGSSNESVRVAKIKLNLLGADPPLNAHTPFDEATTKATKAFQRRHQLTDDGVIGAKTWAALDELTSPIAPDEAHLAFIDAQLLEARTLSRAGLDDEAMTIYEALYDDRQAPPEMRVALTFKMATIHHRRGDFDQALSLYGEYLNLPAIDAVARRDALQRIREARSHQPPGILESTLLDRENTPVG
jgi:hypothetical protein